MNVGSDPQKLLEGALQEQLAAGCPGAILEIHVPRCGFVFSGAQGLFARDGLQPLRPQDAFRAASVTKAVTATLAVYLAATQHWDLDDSVATYLPAPVNK